MPAIRERFKNLSKKEFSVLSAGLVLLLICAAVFLYLKLKTVSQEAYESASPEKIAFLTEKISRNPSDISALYERGRLRYISGPSSWVDAAADLEQAREKGSTEVKIFYYLGHIYSYLGFYEYSAAEFSRYLNNRPSDRQVRLALGKVYYMSKNYPMALSVFEQLLSEKKDEAVLENISLTLWRLKKDFSGPLYEMKKLSPAGSCRADYIMGSIKYEEKSWRESEQALQNAIAPGCLWEIVDKMEIYRKLADDYISLKDEPSAYSALKELALLEPGNEETSAKIERLEKKLKLKERKK